MTENLESILNQTPTELQRWLVERKHPPYRAKQVYQWIYQRRADSFAAMTDLSKPLRDELERSFHLDLPPVAARQHAEKEDTEKILLRLADGEGIECVRMPRYESKIQTDPRSGAIHNKGAEAGSYTLCLSTQAGCLFACRFCASGQRGWNRNLTAGEMAAQVLTFLREGREVSRLVFMGTGEPLHNLAEVQRAIEILCAQEGLAWSPRRITLSTVGLVPEIYRIGREGWMVKLAVSLHATTDAQRAELMPLARGYQLDQLLHALHDYQARNKRRITFEYLMLDSVNDSHADADRLARLCAGLTCHVNLIPFNPITRVPYRPTPAPQVERFRLWLRKQGIDVTVRFSRGRTIDAACGQLRLRQDESS